MVWGLFWKHASWEFVILSVFWGLIVAWASCRNVVLVVNQDDCTMYLCNFFFSLGHFACCWSYWVFGWKLALCENLLFFLAGRKMKCMRRRIRFIQRSWFNEVFVLDACFSFYPGNGLAVSLIVLCDSGLWIGYAYCPMCFFLTFWSVLLQVFCCTFSLPHSNRNFPEIIEEFAFFFFGLKFNLSWAHRSFQLTVLKNC